MCCRYRLSPKFRPDFPPNKRRENVAMTASKVANMMWQTVKVSCQCILGTLDLCCLTHLVMFTVSELTNAAYKECQRLLSQLFAQWSLSTKQLGWWSSNIHLTQVD